MKSSILKGSCLCGGIQYELDRIEEKIGHCHCSMCRKFHGAAFATIGEAKEKYFRFTAGVELLKQYKARNGTIRQFCSNCGASMTFEASDGNNGFVEFTLGTLDSPLDAQPDAHIFVDSKADWVDICDELPQYAEGRTTG